MRMKIARSLPNQLSKIPDRIPGRDEMLELHTGPRTEAGARENIRVAVQYIAPG